MTDTGWKGPQLLLERTDRLLPGLVVELGVGILGLPLTSRMLVEPGVNPGGQVRRKLRVVVNDVLEVGGQVDFTGLDPWEVLV